MKKILLTLLMTISTQAADMDGFFRALGAVESSNNPRAYNKKENAIGIYQIRRLYFIDSNVKGKHESCYNPKVARQVCENYFKRYEPRAYREGNWEVLAKLHNGGCNWRKKDPATQKKLEIYWNKVKKVLND